MSRLEYRNIRSSDSGKTSIFDVFSGDQMLGEIRWYAPWRRYCFYPKDNTLFDRNCLLEVIAMIDQQMQARRGADVGHPAPGEIRQRA